MGWECRFKKDHDKADVGSVTANFVESTGEGDVIVFTKSRRIDSKKDAVQFVKDAKAAKAKHDNDETKNNTVATTIQNLLNK